MSKRYGEINYNNGDYGFYTNRPVCDFKEINAREDMYGDSGRSRRNIKGIATFRGSVVTLTASIDMMVKALKTPAYMGMIGMSSWELVAASSVDRGWFSDDDPMACIPSEDIRRYNDAIDWFTSCLRGVCWPVIIPLLTFEDLDRNEHNPLFGKRIFEITHVEYIALLRQIQAKGPYWLNDHVRATLRKARKSE